MTKKDKIDRKHWIKCDYDEYQWRKLLNAVMDLQTYCDQRHYKAPTGEYPCTGCPFCNEEHSCALVTEPKYYRDALFRLSNEGKIR